jgi:formate dehydrogenase subunit beta
MSNNGKIPVRDRDPVSSLRNFLKTLLADGPVEALLVQQRLPMRNAVMPGLITDPEKLSGADPLAPAFPLNTARLLSRLTRKPLETPIAALMRPCEIRAFVELVKLKQASSENVLLMAIDCYGAYSNTDYSKIAGCSNGDESTLAFYRNIFSSKGTATADGLDISPACRSCEYPATPKADIIIGLFGADIEENLLLISNTAKGDRVLDELNYTGKTGEPAGRQSAIDTLVTERIRYRNRMFEETGDAVADIEKLMTYLADCVNCYNCRVACPVCYCRECVFSTDVFDHEPFQYIRWAKRKGIIKMPTDTVFYHLTRMAHMSTACIGCGQCSNGCPNGVPVMELFRTIAHTAQNAFNYTAGASIEDDPPLSVFREREFPEVTGGKD